MIKIFRLCWLLIKIRISFGSKHYNALVDNHHETHESSHAAPREMLSKTLTKLGPIYIKLGQTLSTRPDLIGEAMAEDLKKLQDKLPPFPTKKAIETIESECKLKIADAFEYFDETPIAAASIAQVHRARLKNGELVAVKILRPNIEKEYASDIRGLRLLAKLTHWLVPKYRSLRASEVVNLFDKTMHAELNLKLEAACASELRDNAQSGIYIPKVYWKYTARRVLVTEWIDGISIYDRDGLVALGLRPLDIATKVVMMFWEQAYTHGFFHADLHPGNILVRKDGQIALVDFGIMSRLPERDRFCVAEILGAFLLKDYLRVAEVHLRAGYIPQETDLYAFAQQCRIIAEPIIGLNLSDISIAKLLEELFAVTEEFGMEVQPQILMLQKTMVVVEGIGKSLDPDINIWKLAEPWMKKWANKNISPEAKFFRLVQKIAQDYFV